MASTSVQWVDEEDDDDGVAMTCLLYTSDAADE